MTRFLILDAYSQQGRDRLASAGLPLAGTMYRNMVHRHRPDSESDIVCIAEPQARPPQPLESYDAMLWTGSSLSIYEDLPEVHRQIELARHAFDIGVPAYGSCWALQLAVVAAGGEVERSPHGLTFGLSYGITLTPEGQAHPIYKNRASPFDALASHYDIVKTMPPGGTVLARSHRSNVQAAMIEHKKSTFFATQYHPEFNFEVLSGMTHSRKTLLVEQGFYPDLAAAETQACDFEHLHSPTPVAELVAKYKLTDSVLDIDQRQNEFKNWLSLLAL